MRVCECTGIAGNDQCILRVIQISSQLFVPTSEGLCRFLVARREAKYVLGNIKIVLFLSYSKKKIQKYCFVIRISAIIHPIRIHRISKTCINAAAITHVDISIIVYLPNLPDRR